MNDWTYRSQLFTNDTDLVRAQGLVDLNMRSCLNCTALEGLGLSLQDDEKLACNNCTEMLRVNFTAVTKVTNDERMFTGNRINPFSNSYTWRIT